MGSIKARVQNGISGSYMDAVFKFVVPEESEVSDLDKATTQFYQGRLTAAARLVEFVASV